MPEKDVHLLVGHLFREEAGKMAAVLIRILGFENLTTAEDIVQDTMVKALSAWKIKGTPENPAAWLHTVAKRKAIDLLRQRKVRSGIHSEIAEALRSEYTLSPAISKMFLDNEIEDSQLRMIFACCHPKIPYESQVAFTLKTLCGLSVSEIASAFLTSEETIAKRIYRAKEKIREENISMEAPAPAAMPERLAAVIHTLYLLFNEGYNSSHSKQIIRCDLCEEAIRLCILLTRNSVTNLPQVNALLALMCLQASREDARVDAHGEVIVLQHQDRSHWNRKLIEKGLTYLDAASTGEEISAYHIEAAIAACHAMAPTFSQTNWHEIYRLYEVLEKIKPGPVVELNKAIAIGYWQSPRHGIEALLKIDGLEKSHIYQAALGDFYARVNAFKESKEAYERALTLTRSQQERNLLNQKLEAVHGHDRAGE